MQRTTLDNGIEVLTERIAGVRSAAVGFWIRHGSAHEFPYHMGVSHLLEHMVFKGTDNRSAREIAMALEGLGGSLDAYTSREHTSFQARVLDEHVPQALDVLSDLVRYPAIRARDLDLEREVVLEEIAAVEDTPDDLVFELHGQRLWGGHPYGYSILGTRESVSALTVDHLRELHASQYCGLSLVVAAAGNVDHHDVVERADRLLGNLPRGEKPTGIERPLAQEWHERLVERESAQTHIVFGTLTPPHSHPSRYALVLLSAAFGGGMSSRLFQRVREEMALAYSVYSFQSFYSQSGVSGVYVGTRPEWGDRAVEAIREEFAGVSAEGLSQDELRQTQQQVKGQIMLSLESTGARLYRLAGCALYDEPFLTLDELLTKVDEVTDQEIAEVAAAYFDPHHQVVLRLGPSE